MNNNLLSAVAGMFGAAAGDTSSAGHWWLPEDVSTTARQIDHLFNVVLLETGIAFGAVVLLLIYFAIRYRQRPGHRALYTHGDERRHLLLTLSLALVVFIAVDMNIVRIANATQREIRDRSPDPADALVIEVLAEQFVWNIRYAGRDAKFNTIDDLVVRNEIHVPVNQPVLVRLRSRDVIHSFFLPHLRLKMDSVPGMTTGVWFEATRKGQFDLACAELCGWGHYIMRGRLTVETPEEFNRWLEEQYAEMERDQ